MTTCDGRRRSPVHSPTCPRRGKEDRQPSGTERSGGPLRLGDSQAPAGDGVLSLADYDTYRDAATSNSWRPLPQRCRWRPPRRWCTWPTSPRRPRHWTPAPRARTVPERQAQCQDGRQLVQRQEQPGAGLAGQADRHGVEYLSQCRGPALVAHGEPADLRDEGPLWTLRVSQYRRRTDRSITTGRPPAASSATCRTYRLCSQSENSPWTGHATATPARVRATILISSPPA